MCTSMGQLELKQGLSSQGYLVDISNLFLQIIGIHFLVKLDPIKRLIPIWSPFKVIGQGQPTAENLVRSEV